MVAITFGKTGLPRQVHVKANKPVTIKFDSAGISEIKRAMASQNVTPWAYHGVDTWRANAEGIRHSATGDKPFVEQFAFPATVPGTGTPGVQATQINAIKIPAMKKGETTELWLKMQVGASTGYWSNLGDNIKIVAD